MRNEQYRFLDHLENADKKVFKRDKQDTYDKKMSQPNQMQTEDRGSKARWQAPCKNHCTDLNELLQTYVM